VIDPICVAFIYNRKGQADRIKSNQMKPLGPVSKNASPFCDSAGRAAEYCAAAQAAPAPAGPGASGSGRARPPGGALRLCLACCHCTCTHWLARGRNKKKKKRTGQATSFQTNRRLALGPSHLIHRPPKLAAPRSSSLLFFSFRFVSFQRQADTV
jgi:hypothetical protein